MSKIIRIALIGPESSGKTTLAQQLAEHYNTIWVPEYSRDYVSALNRKYTKEDILHCAKMQWKSEQDSLPKANKFLFVDTELINYSVWLKDVFDETDAWIEKTISENPYDLYLLISGDIPFVDDPVRENPHRREYFYNWYKRELDNRGLNYAIIQGSNRLQMAIKVITSVQP